MKETQASLVNNRSTQNQELKADSSTDEAKS
jgi:hypothetical protein